MKDKDEIPEPIQRMIEWLHRHPEILAQPLVPMSNDPKLTEQLRKVIEEAKIKYIAGWNN
jgi:hypothetical protein